VPSVLLRLYRGSCVCYNRDRFQFLKNPLNITSTSEARIPAPQYENQDRIFSRAFQILADAVEQKAFPGAATAVTHGGKLVALKALGRFTFDVTSPPVEAESIFDLASLTKVVATTSMAMILYERGLLDLEMPVVTILPEFRSEDSRRKEIILRQLMAHSSGLPWYERLFLRTHSRDELLREAFAVPLKHDPGARAEYSDVGFILLGVTLERIAGEPLDRFCQREIFGPLGMSHTSYNPPASSRSKIPPTVDDQTFRKRIIQGEVQDENASVMGGVAPHAGLFATPSDLAIFAQAILNGGALILRRETLSFFTRREQSPAGTSRALGWDTPSKPSQSGKYFSPSSFGHLGYTGTSLWIDPERDVSITLLTNRTWPDCSNWAIKEVRPAFHDAVMEALGVAQ
jgi:CubicO group peptidase (beta-lactamase class C family)